MNKEGGGTSNPSDSSQWFIRDCPPIDEDMEECKARLVRIVRLQTECYGTFHLLPPSNLDEYESPKWLHADFLFRINYGQGIQADAAVARQSLQLSQPRGHVRARVTLLDRHLGDLLHQALFRASPLRLFLSDWNELGEGEQLTGTPSATRLSPFDYPFDEGFNDEVEPLLMIEEFVTFCVWDCRYAPVLGSHSRPSLNAVALDMIDMVRCFASFPQSTPRPLVVCFQDFLSQHRLRSIPHDVVCNDSALYGYLLDLFRRVIAWYPSSEGFEDRYEASFDLFGKVLLHRNWLT